MNQLLSRLHAAGAEFTSRLVEPIGEVYRVPVLQWVAPQVGPGLFNAAAGVTEGSALPAILDRFRHAGVAPRVEVIAPPEPLRRALAHHGLVLRGRRRLMTAKPRSESMPAQVRELTALDQEHFATYNALAGGAPALAAATETVWKKGRAGRWFVVEVDGHPAAGAVLFEHNGVGYLATAQTMPQYRRQGLHQTLIKARMAAATPSVGVYCARVAPDSNSQRNLERLGFRVAGEGQQFEPR